MADCLEKTKRYQALFKDCHPTDHLTADYSVILPLEYVLSSPPPARFHVSDSWYSWYSLYKVADNCLVWLGENVVLDFTGENLGRLINYRHVLTIDFGRRDILSVWAAPTIENSQLHETLAILFMWLATHDQTEVRLRGSKQHGLRSDIQPLLPLHGPVLSEFLTDCDFENIQFSGLTVNHDFFEALSQTTLRPTIALELYQCTVPEQAESAFVECYQAGHGPHNLHECSIPIFTLARALKVESNLASLTPYRSADHQGQLTLTEHAELADALADNKNLLKLDLSGQRIPNITLTLLCESLATHSTLQTLNLQRTAPDGELSDDCKTARMQALADMMETNPALQVIHLTPQERDDVVLMSEIRPRLLANFYRPMVKKVKKLKGKLRRHVLLRQLQVARDNPNRFWMFLSENVECLTEDPYPKHST